MRDFKIMPVIMSGGAGSRLWPASRAAAPKQLLELVTENTMVQDTALRVSGEHFTAPVFICNAAHSAAINAQMEEIGTPALAIITEPIGRNTAPAAVVAAQYAKGYSRKSGERTLVLLLPADHHVTEPEAFRDAVNAAASAALSGHLVTFGITPDAPETGYGYIERGAAIDTRSFAVSAFREKPDVETAKRYLESGNFAWNAGIFLFSPETFLSEIERFEPELMQAAIAAFDAAKAEGSSLHLDRACFETCPSESIDYAVMEKTTKAAIVPCDIGWNDIGSFSALFGVTQDETGMSVPDGTINIGSSGCLVHSDGPMVSLVGVKNLAVIVKDGAVLVVDMEHSQDVKKVVTELKSSGRTELL
jgi:mannose-1-phosphate guanylyltransferase/mannose-1-phosphate guanylyltransferase/mannose-6-phosphate isomerase